MNVPISTAPATSRMAVIGAGPMGLAAAYELAKRGARVTLYERDDRLGGMSAHLDFAGTRIERYYHFVCAPDTTTFRYLDELGIGDRLRWVETKMGFFHDGVLYDWGDPVKLLRFPGLTLVQKIRYGLHLMKAKSISDWRPYDAFSSTKWLEDSIGKKAYDVMWRPLFRYKFYEYEDSLSAAWLGDPHQARGAIAQEHVPRTAGLHRGRVRGSDRCPRRSNSQPGRLDRTVEFGRRDRHRPWNR
jgi:protoporphyrinogen oxidase